MAESKSACVVLHGKAAMRDDVRAAVETVRARGHRIDVRVLPRLPAEEISEAFRVLLSEGLEEIRQECAARL